MYLSGAFFVVVFLPSSVTFFPPSPAYVALHIPQTFSTPLSAPPFSELLRECRMVCFGVFLLIQNHVQMTLLASDSVPYLSSAQVCCATLVYDGELSMYRNQPSQADPENHALLTDASVDFFQFDEFITSSSYDDSPSLISPSNPLTCMKFARNGVTLVNPCATAHPSFPGSLASTLS